MDKPSKSMLVINTPRVCCQCPLYANGEMEQVKYNVYRQHVVCKANGNELSNMDCLGRRPPWCPLQEV